MQQAIAIIGPKQAGKSRLMNVLSGKDYSDKPARFRKVGESILTEYAPEHIQSNSSLIKNADKIFLVLDLSSPTLENEAQQYLVRLQAFSITPEKIFVVGQKSDLISSHQPHLPQLLSSLIQQYKVSPQQLFVVNALHKNGIDALLRLTFLSTVPVAAVQVAAGQVQQQLHSQYGMQHVAPVVTHSQHKQFRLPSHTTLTMPSGHVNPKNQVSAADTAEIDAIWRALHAYLAPQRSFFRRELHLHRRHWLTEVGGFMQKHQAQKDAGTLSLEDMKRDLANTFQGNVKPIHAGGHIDRMLKRWNIALAVVDADAAQAQNPAVEFF